MKISDKKEGAWGNEKNPAVQKKHDKHGKIFKGEKEYRTVLSKFQTDSHIAFLAIYRLERHNQYNRNTFLYQNC